VWFPDGIALRLISRSPVQQASECRWRRLADAGHGDRVLCQRHEQALGDSAAVVLDESEFASGSLRVTSYARPGKLFTASSDLITGEVGLLTPEARTRIIDAVVAADPCRDSYAFPGARRSDHDSAEATARVKAALAPLGASRP
jgi:hypothetical protein